MKTSLPETPLIIQSIAYDPDQKSILGETGMDTLLHKTVAVHNLEEAEHYCQLKGIALEDYIQEKAKSIGFKAIFPKV